MEPTYETNREVLRRTEELPVDRKEQAELPAPLLRALQADLAGAVTGEVHFEDGYRALYATDASNYRQPPIGVVLPRSIEDIEAAVAVCRRYGVPILPRGGGTSLGGQCCNVAVVLDLSKHLRGVLELDPVRKLARVQPGVVLDDLRKAAERHHLTFAPDPSTHAYCTLGGMLGNNSCGVRSVMAGADRARTSDQVEWLDVLSYDGLNLRAGATSEAELEQIIAAGGRRGEIYAGLRRIRDRYADEIRQRFPKIPRRVSGYNLDELLPEKGFHVGRALVGTEGTCVTILEAGLQLVHSPPARSVVVLGFEDVFRAAEAVPRVLEHLPTGLEGMDEQLVQDIQAKGQHSGALKILPQGKGWLIVELGGETRAEAEAKAQALVEAFKGQPSRTYADKRHEQIVWEVREAGLGATARVPGHHDAWPGWEDSAVHPAKLPEYLRGVAELYRKYGYHAALYGHFGQGCVHTRIDFHLEDAAGLERYRAFVEEASDLCIALGGSLSGEHGDGQARGELLPKMFGPTLMRAFTEFKALFDPGDRMNPGKVVRASGEPAYRITENLRLGTEHTSAHPETHFRFLDDGGDFARATERCVGVGKCRREEGGTMCPSFMVTHEEQHTTRGRAHVLFEMLRGGVEHQGWRSEGVKEALDLCLACKGCKSDCPMNVDMATYKAEFLSHYYEGRLRPRAAYTMGLIAWWARLASLAPRLANLVSHAPVVGRAFKALAGVAPEREVPRFAPRTLRQQFARRPASNPQGPRVLLWPDTFTDHFHPEIGLAAADVLEAAGFHVELPRARLCCGRPLYDYGMLSTAKGLLREVLSELGPDLEHGVPVVGLEPSCVAVFRDELGNLFPSDRQAVRLSQQTFTLAEFMERYAPEFELPKLNGDQAVVQAHCHHKAVIGFDSEEKLMKRLGLEAQVLDSGCCGMAGSFGFEADKYGLSQACGERVLFPEVRKNPDSLVIADGFSCRTQIEQGTGRRPLHVAEVAKLAMEQRPLDVSPAPRPRRPGRVVVALGTGAAALLGLVALLRGADRLRRSP